MSCWFGHQCMDRFSFPERSFLLFLLLSVFVIILILHGSNTYRFLDPFIIRIKKETWLTHSPHDIRAYVHSYWVNVSENIILIERCSVIVIDLYLSSLNSLSIAYSVIMSMDPVNISNLLVGMMLSFISRGY